MQHIKLYQNKVAIVTGGSSGIGAALATKLAGYGARVVVADRQVALAESVVAEIQASGGTSVASELDVRQLRSMKKVVDETIARWGAVHYFFNNAGISVGGDVEHYDARDWDEIFDVNLRGVAYGIQAVYPVMIKQREGHIINTASVGGLIATLGAVSYTASKHAVVGLTKGLRIEAKRHNVRVSALCPGAVRTPILVGGKYGRLNFEGASDDVFLKFWERLRPTNPDVLAAKALAAIARNEAIIVLPSWWKVAWALDRLFPALSALISEVGLNQMRNELKAAGIRPAQRTEVPALTTTRADRSAH